MNAENCMQNVKKFSIFSCGGFLSKIERNAYISQILVCCSVKDLFSFNRDGVCITYGINGPNSAKQVINLFLFSKYMYVINFTTCVGKSC